MGREEEIVKERLKKIHELKKKGINPYPTRFDVKNNSVEIQKKHKSLKAGATTKASVKIAGRILSIRDMGRIAFGVLDDGYGKVQILLQERATPAKIFEFFKEFVDTGDFVGVEGIVSRTQRGELSIVVKNLEMLTKSVLPLPEKFHGIRDEDERLRKRYLEIVLNPEVKEMFIRKSKFWQTIREFLLERGFLELDTPVLENIPGGAEAKPFITHHNALNEDVYLRISDELWLKRLMVAGYPKVFEIGRIFRNEGMDAEHLQDYTQVEFYWAYADYNDGMKLAEEMYKKIAKEVFGTLKFKIKEFDVDLGKKWDVYDYVPTIKKMTGINVLKADLKKIEKKLKDLKVDYEKKGLNLNRAVDNLWKYCRKKIAGPGFLINVPVMMEPLAKRSDKNPEVVERFQIILAGSEMGKGFSELNDPVDQMGRFEDQQKLREAGDEEAQMTDTDFVEALKYGMPPTFGFGISERLFSFLENKPIREAVIFPLMKPEKEKISAKEAEKRYRSKKIIVISDESHYGVSANAIGQLGIAIGGHSREKLFDLRTLTDKEGNTHYTDSLYPMTNLAGTQKQMAEFAQKCYKAGIQFFDFSDIMRNAHTDEQMTSNYKERKTSDIGYIAVGAIVPKDFEKEFLSKLRLFGSK